MRRSERADRERGAPVMSRIIFALLLCAACGGVVRGARAQSLEEKLGVVTDYVPKTTAPVNQLVEVAQRFKLPMAVEWVEREGEVHTTLAPAADSPERTVKELIWEIVARAPEHRVEIEDGLLRVYSPGDALHPFNFLNIRLQSYYVNDDDLFAAEDQLRWAIRFTLTPEKYRNGYAGGYGHGSPEVFQFPKFTLSATDITIREVLNRIVKAQGNAMWVVTLKGAELDRHKPYWKGKDPDEVDAPLTSRWRFLPLSSIAELAKEQLAIDVSVNGLFDKRMTTIPVMMEYNLHGDEGGSQGGAYEDGTTYSYGARIEKMEQEGVTLFVELKVKRAGEVELKFAEKLQVKRDQVIEVRPQPGIRISAYFETRSENSSYHE